MKHKKGNNVNGWLIIDKPEGMGSTQVVSITKRLFNAKKNGHAGTLDPFATGVLPIAFGEATKLIDFVMDGSKEYEFTIRFGYETDTGDCTGTKTISSENIPTKEQILSILPSFIGKIKQTPPAYSAIKINGERAYNLARKGENVEIKEREIEIFSLQLITYEKDIATLKTVCSKGTYIRSLGQDIARAIDCCGHLTSLRRTKCGIFSIGDTILLDNLKNMVYIAQTLLPLETSLRDIAVMAVSEDEASKLKQGQALSPKGRKDLPNNSSRAVAVCNQVLIAIVRIEETKISPIRVFNLT
ncbi:MAG: tRNA pseudouridine(55) synthase TruB [Alphaproteobacteria bacterium]|nr:tRNA pseudouridine(55) synthase TruB [Alphaproteobacteria bacterium]